MAAEDEVPPLEDMSEVLERSAHLRGSTSLDYNIGTIKSSSNRLIEENYAAHKEVTHESQYVKACNAGSTSTANLCGSSDNSSHKKSDKAFGGLKKGFLFGSSCKKPVVDKDRLLSTSKDSDDLIIVKPTCSKEDSLIFEDVQQARRMNETLNQNKDQWLTDDLLSRVQSNPMLCAQLMNPAMTRALADLQSNPQEAWEKYKNDPPTMAALKEFSSILGDHFETIADKQDKTSKNNVSIRPQTDADMKVVSSTDPRQQQAADDERRINELLSQPEIREILMDDKIKQLMALLRNDPDKAQHQLHTADSLLRAKIQRLVQVGLLQFDR